MVKNGKVEAARVILVYPMERKYGRPSQGFYNSPVLVRESSTGKYALPGGQLRIQGREASKAELKESARRELKEELGLEAKLADLHFAFQFQGHKVIHTVFYASKVAPLDAAGFVHPNFELTFKNKSHEEISHLGFYNAGSHRNIDIKALERHVSDLYGLRGYMILKPTLSFTKGLQLNPNDRRSFREFFAHRDQNWDPNWQP